MKRFFGGLLTALLLVACLFVWTMLPWYVVLALAVVVAAWLLFTHSHRVDRGRLARKLGAFLRDETFFPGGDPLFRREFPIHLVSSIMQSEEWNQRQAVAHRRLNNIHKPETQRTSR